MNHPGNPKHPIFPLGHLLYGNATDQFLKALKDDHTHRWDDTAITINGVDFNWSDLRSIAFDFAIMSRVADTELHSQKREVSRLRGLLEAVQNRRWKAMTMLLTARKDGKDSVDRVALEKALGVPQPKVDNSKKKA
ncbi:hypothetical protein SEA_ZOOMAN_231 [Microbacterium phage Zooman]|nr:hypothetical protein SEA_ZOOMAN_231 [Microbacterium phage Zooman]